MPQLSIASITDPSSPFQVAAQNTTVQEFNLVAFQSPLLSPGEHRLFVQYGVDNLNNSLPLNLDSFIIQNLTLPSFTQSPPNTTSIQSPTITTIIQNPTITQIFYRAGLSEGVIAGVVIGTLGGLALIIFILIWAIRFIKGRKKAVGPEPVPLRAHSGNQYSDQASWCQDNLKVDVK